MGPIDTPPKISFPYRLSPDSMSGPRPVRMVRRALTVDGSHFSTHPPEIRPWGLHPAGGTSCSSQRVADVAPRNCNAGDRRTIEAVPAAAGWPAPLCTSLDASCRTGDPPCDRAGGEGLTGGVHPCSRSELRVQRRMAYVPSEATRGRTRQSACTSSLLHAPQRDSSGRLPSRSCCTEIAALSAKSYAVDEEGARGATIGVL